MMTDIVKVLAKRSKGFTRKELSEKAGYSEGGTLTKALNALIASDFVIKYIPFGCGKREAHYKLTDPFCIFYLRFVDNYDSLPDTFWQQNVTSQRINVWRGYSFENVVNMCEIKFYSDLFAVDKNYDLLLRHRHSLLGEEIPKKSIVHSTLITTYGIKNNEYRWAFDNVVTMDDLFL